MKDTEYFQKIVKKGLKSKLELDLVDEFLLGKDLSKYAEPHGNK